MIRYLREHKLQQYVLAQQLHITPTNFSRQLRGKAKIPTAVASELYTLLKKPEELVFLIQQSDHLWKHWQDLYRTYTQTLEQSYLQRSPEERGKILGELEQLIRKYE